jgi:hypothetical protein
MPRGYIEPTYQLQPIDLVSPGFRGLNLVQSGSILSPAYATEATNTVLDANGLLAARDGVTNLTTTPIAGNPIVRTLHEFVKEDGTVSLVVAWNGGIGTAVADPAGSDISGAVTDANGTWQFLNFNNKVVGLQPGLKPIVYTGAGNFATVVESSGTAPTGGIGTAAFGRVWVVRADKQTIDYSGLLNETQWASGGAGSIDMRTVWTHGTDEVRAIVAFNGALVVFGYNHIVFWTDGRGSVLGIDPTQMYVSDVVPGTGCVSRFSVQPVGETDLLFLSPNGVQSIQRLVAERSSPISTLSKYVRDALLSQLGAENIENIRSTYNPLTGFYLLSFPVATTVWVLDQRRRYRDEDQDLCSVITLWNLSLTAMLTRRVTNTTLVARTAGRVGQYVGDNDEGTVFRFSYKSPWLDLGEEIANRLKILKRIGAILFVRNATTVDFKWSVDFDPTFDILQRTIDSTGTSSEFNLAEFNIAEFGGGLALKILKVPARGRGQYFRIGIEANVNGEFALQQSELFTKIGRLA